MSQQDNFSSGFFLGALVGGVVGGVLGALLTSQRLNEDGDETGKPELSDAKTAKAKKRAFKPSTEQNIELARRSLEDKIAQLNDAIDDVRQQLSTVNGRSIERDRDSSLTEEP
jgi:gas vesicle protein